MALMIRVLFSLLFLISLLSIISCTTNTTTSPATPGPSYSPSETTQVTPTQSYNIPKYTMKVTITSTPTPGYTASGAAQEKLQETAQAFGRDIPIPTYLPEGYAITDVQLIQKQDSYAQAKLTITASGKPDISLQITWSG
jgi:hypothetical protein